MTIVEFTDYQCPYCRRHALATLPELQRTFIATGRARYVIRDLPLPIHPFAEASAKAARCAGRQRTELYWIFHDSLFSTTKPHTKATVWRVARRMGLDERSFRSCMVSPEISRAVASDRAEAESRSLLRTPTFVIGPTRPDSVEGIVLGGAYPVDAFAATINKILLATSPKPKESR